MAPALLPAKQGVEHLSGYLLETSCLFGHSDNYHGTNSQRPDDRTHAMAASMEIVARGCKFLSYDHNYLQGLVQERTFGQQRSL
jgi:hypothetical protein